MVLSKIYNVDLISNRPIEMSITFDFLKERLNHITFTQHPIVEDLPWEGTCYIVPLK